MTPRNEIASRIPDDDNNPAQNTPDNTVDQPTSVLPTLPEDQGPELLELLQDAGVLLAAGMNDDHPDDEQIRDIKAAIDLYEQVLNALPDDNTTAAQRTQIEQAIQQARREIERLELRSFFGEDDDS